MSGVYDPGTPGTSMDNAAPAGARVSLVHRVVGIGVIGCLAALIIGALSISSQARYNASLEEINATRAGAIISSILGKNGSDARGYQTAYA